MDWIYKAVAIGAVMGYGLILGRRLTNWLRNRSDGPHE